MQVIFVNAFQEHFYILQIKACLRNWDERVCTFATRELRLFSRIRSRRKLPTSVKARKFRYDFFRPWGDFPQQSVSFPSLCEDERRRRRIWKEEKKFAIVISSFIFPGPLIPELSLFSIYCSLDELMIIRENIINLREKIVRAEQSWFWFLFCNPAWNKNL